MPAFMKKFFDMLSPADSEDYDEVDESISESSKKPEVKKDSKVINMGKIENEISCFKPTEYNKSIAEIADSLKSGCIVIIDFGIESSNPEVARRIIDWWFK